MFENLDIFRTAHAMAVHAGAQQNVLAQNMANADTPDYTARDLIPFTDVMGDAPVQAGMRATRAAHLTAETSPFQASVVERDGQHDPNGNSVSLETEMLNAVEAKRQHDKALAIYRSSLTILRTSLGRS